MKLIALFKKEFYRFFHDPRLIITVLLPGIIIFALYSFLGSVVNQNEEKNYVLAIEHNSAIVEVIKSAVEESGSTLEVRSVSFEEGKKLVEEKKAHLFLSFPENFDLGLLGSDAGEVLLYYDAAEDDSASLYQMTASVLQTVGMKFQIRAESVTSIEELSKFIISDLLPFLVVTLVFSACMSVTLESIAGEKERGTLATVLATSVPRYQIALGKIVPLSCVAAIGAASSFIGVYFSLPKLMGTSLGALGGYGFLSYLFMLLLIISFVPLIVGAIAAVSTLSKSVKEASAYTSVIMIVIMVLSLTSSFLELGNWATFVPVLNAVYLTGLILKGNLSILLSLSAIGINLAFTALFVFLVSKMLSSERIMFGK